GYSQRGIGGRRRRSHRRNQTLREHEGAFGGGSHRHALRSQRRNRGQIIPGRAQRVAASGEGFTSGASIETQLSLLAEDFSVFLAELLVVLVRSLNFLDEFDFVRIFQRRIDAPQSDKLAILGKRLGALPAIPVVDPKLGRIWILCLGANGDV